MREHEIATVIAQVGPLAADASVHLEAILSASEAIGNRTVPEVLLQALQDFREAADLIDAGKKAIAAYLSAEPHKVPRRHVAEALGVAPGTIQRWLSELKQAEQYGRHAELNQKLFTTEEASFGYDDTE